MSLNRGDTRGKINGGDFKHSHLIGIAGSSQCSGTMRPFEVRYLCDCCEEVYRAIFDGHGHMAYRRVEEATNG